MMGDPQKPSSLSDRPWTRHDEENLLLEISEDRRLQNLGIDPDSDSLAILIALKKRMAEIQRSKDQPK